MEVCFINWSKPLCHFYPQLDKSYAESLSPVILSEAKDHIKKRGHFLASFFSFFSHFMASE